MSWTKVEDLALLATMIATTAPKYFSTWKPTVPFASQVNSRKDNYLCRIT